MQSTSAQVTHEHESYVLEESPSRGDEPKALHYFHAKTFLEAAGSARALLRRAETCPRCSRALAHLYDRLGSTLFRDDDPQELIAAFDAEDGNMCTLQVLAACIVLNGRDRVVPTTH